ncbi:MAG: 50S ribosomal protein L15 [Candidatus Thermoplasmatota archaeon]|jgi:large subunit ribosomal protein L15|nr:50S ribosomal protein L15 [Candidatus Thermoplasmatota archaeon]MCL5786225.1 50S ribosomal protein L15 [Candidatus Thermoplasmatota archaeon]
MVRNKTKKQRGGHYGRGMKAGRGKGKRGGSGMAGLGKHLWIWMVKYDPLHYGGKGFTSHHFSRKLPPITLRELETALPMLKENGFVREEENALEIDLKTAGYGKLLGSGMFPLKSRIIVPEATEKAISKLSVHGSTVEVDEHSTEK